MYNLTYLVVHMSCAPYSLVSACFLLAAAAVIQAVRGGPDALSVAFLLVGVTSVIHHSRLDEWWKRDFWRALDYAMIVLFTIVAFSYYSRRAEWLSTCAFVLVTAALIWTNLIPEVHVPAVHACIHVAVAICMLYLAFFATGATSR